MNENLYSNLPYELQKVYIKFVLEIELKNSLFNNSISKLHTTASLKL